MLNVYTVSKTYGKTLACNQISFQVNPGELAVLMGPNGAGKSTIIKCISGLLRFSGEITIDNYPNKSVEAKQLFGFAPEVPFIYELLTVEEHLEFIARAYKLKNWENYAEDLLQRFDLNDKRKKMGSELSKGMQQKTSLCCSLLHKPKVVMMDEAMVGLDPHAIKELELLLNDLRNEGSAILFSTHIIGSMEKLWDKALILMNGNLVATRTKKEIEASGEDLETLFFSITEPQKAYTPSKEV